MISSDYTVGILSLGQSLQLLNTLFHWVTLTLIDVYIIDLVVEKSIIRSWFYIKQQIIIYHLPSVVYKHIIFLLRLLVWDEVS